MREGLPLPVLPSYSLGEPAVLAFVVIPVALVLLLAAGAWVAWRRAGEPIARSRRAALVTVAAGAIWMALTWAAAATGVLSDFERTPPPFMFLVAAIFGGAVFLAASRFGSRVAEHLPLWTLVSVQGFRLPLEIAMHQMYERGIMPGQMSYSGRNFDVITGATAILVAIVVWAGYGGRRLVLLWNLLGLALLANIIVVAIASTPRFARFGPDQLNVWVMLPPFVWLPAVMVLVALAGHLVVFRALATRSR